VAAVSGACMSQSALEISMTRISLERRETFRVVGKKSYKNKNKKNLKSDGVPLQKKIEIETKCKSCFFRAFEL
jgi:hypothetical protein